MQMSRRTEVTAPVDVGVCKCQGAQESWSQLMSGFEKLEVRRGHSPGRRRGAQMLRCTDTDAH